MKRPWVNLEVGGLGSWSAEGRRGEEHCFADDHPGQDDLGGDGVVQDDEGGDGVVQDDEGGDGVVQDDLGGDGVGDGNPSDGCGDHDQLFV